MRVLVTGGTGFTGSHLLPLLVKRGHRVACLVRNAAQRDAVEQTGAEAVPGDLADRQSLSQAMAGCQILFNVASVGFGHAPNIVAAAQDAGLERAIFVSTTAIFTSLAASSKAVRLAAEETINQSGLAWTVLRPTMIYGTDRDRNMCRLIRYLNKWPVITILGPGTFLQQPVYVQDVAGALFAAAENEATVGRAYNIAGATPLSFNQVIDTVCTALGRRVAKLHLPSKPLLAGLSTAEKLGLRLPIKTEQIMRLNEDKAFDYSAASRDFGFAPLTFKQGIKHEVAQMGLGSASGDA